ncbi:Rid family hydrolase [Pelagibaculum spongiae]|uniref:Rid family hydrolase n=1 Tax=Pelagibaculum spongiae TaxID=2080658 RepID=UPI0019D4CE58
MCWRWRWRWRLNKYLKTNCFLSNIEDFAAFNTVYNEYFQEKYPARSCFAVKTLPLGVKAEIEAITHKS